MWGRSPAFMEDWPGSVTGNVVWSERLRTALIETETETGPRQGPSPGRQPRKAGESLYVAAAPCPAWQQVPFNCSLATMVAK